MIVSIFATHPDGSLNVPRIPEDRALLKEISKDKTIICGSTIAKQIRGSYKKIVVSRVSGEDYEVTVDNLMKSLRDEHEEDYIIYGGHRIYAVANKYADVIYRIIVQAPRAEPGADAMYGFASVPDNFDLVHICDLGIYSGIMTPHIVEVYHKTC